MQGIQTQAALTAAHTLFGLIPPVCWLVLLSFYFHPSQLQFYHHLCCCCKWGHELWSVVHRISRKMYVVFTAILHARMHLLSLIASTHFKGCAAFCMCRTKTLFHDKHLFYVCQTTSWFPIIKSSCAICSVLILYQSSCGHFFNTVITCIGNLHAIGNWSWICCQCPWILSLSGILLFPSFVSCLLFSFIRDL